MATSAFVDIRRSYPNAHIAILVKPGRDGILAGGDYYDELIVDRSPRGLGELMATARELRRRRFDLAILFSDSFRVAAMTALAGIPRRVGYRRNLRSLLLTEPLRYPGLRGVKTPEPMPARYGRILSVLGITPGDSRPVLRVTENEEARLRDRRAKLGVRDGEQLVGLNPGAAFGASKMWPPEHFARLGDAIVERFGARAVILVGPGEEPIAVAIERRMRHRPVSTANSLVPLDELKALVRDLRLLVTTDTGPRHYAVAFRVPVVVLMGPTDPRYTNINLDETELLRREDVECIACHHKVCPIDHRCMRWITPEHVLDRIDRLNEQFDVFGLPKHPGHRK